MARKAKDFDPVIDRILGRARFVFVIVALAAIVGILFADTLHIALSPITKALQITSGTQR